ncbi:MAG: RHS repeat-associated core domain-containing protein [Planctomycetes bacterium]|nr:RHS repeat-associated core domain-containing protein [Planctomycetota bacterium]
MDRVTHPTPSHTHELVTAGGQSVTHDTKGNLLLIPASVRANSSPLVLTWDFGNRMVSADVGADSVIDVTHQYDALGRRVARTASGSTTVFVQVAQQTICDYASGAAPALSTYRYLYGSYIDEPIVRIATSNSEMTWYHRNQQYSIVACTDSSGAATERYAYTAYGLPTITDGSGTVRTSSAIGNRYTYTGREWDGVLGLYHYRARMYEATVGRFCSRDPIGYVDGSSLYGQYIRMQHLDSMGLFCNTRCSTSFKPQDAAKMPYRNLGPLPAPPGEVTLGLADVNVEDFQCTCKEDCGGWYVDYVELNVVAEITFYVRLAKKYGPTWTLETVYGHEQRHVLNYKGYFENEGFREFCDFYRAQNRPGCKYYKDEMKCLWDGCGGELLFKTWALKTEARSREDHKPDNDSVPLPKTPYDPVPPRIGDEIK